MVFTGAGADGDDNFLFFTKLLTFGLWVNYFCYLKAKTSFYYDKNRNILKQNEQPASFTSCSPASGELNVLRVSIYRRGARVRRRHLTNPAQQLSNCWTEYLQK